MVKYTQTIRRQQPTNCLSVLDHFVGLVLKGLKSLSLLQSSLSSMHAGILDTPLSDTCSLNDISSS